MIFTRESGINGVAGILAQKNKDKNKNKKINGVGGIFP